MRTLFDVLVSEKKSIQVCRVKKKIWCDEYGMNTAAIVYGCGLFVENWKIIGKICDGRDLIQFVKRIIEFCLCMCMTVPCAWMYAWISVYVTYKVFHELKSYSLT